MGEDIAEIGRQRARWIAAINEADADGFVSVLAEDAVWLPSSGAAISGRDGIRAWLRVPFSEFQYDYHVADVSLRVTGDWAVEQASFSTSVVPKTGEDPLPTHRGRYTLVWHRLPAGEWKIDRYIDHSGEFEAIDLRA